MKKRIFTWLMTLCVMLCLMPVSANAATKPDTPMVKVSNTASTGKTKLNWGKIEDAKSYRIYRATSKKGTYKKIKTTSKTYYADSSAEVGKRYYYKVKAVEADGDTSDSSKVVSSVRDLARPDVTAENTASTGKVKLSWKEIDGAQKYVVYRATSKSGEYQKLKTTTKTYYTDSSAEVGTTYYYQVVAVYKTSSANSARSKADKAVRDLPRPDVSVNLNSNDQPKLSWEAIAGAKKYVVYRSATIDGEYAKMKTVTATEYTDETAEVGKTYYYKVKAIHEKSSANSAYSKVCKIAVPEHTHTEFTETEEATCANAGYTRVICTECNEILSETKIPRLECSYTNTERMSAVGKRMDEQGNWNYSDYVRYPDWIVDTCSGCGYPDMETLRFAYTQREAAEIMLGYVNALREEVYGSDKYNLVLDDTLMELAEIRAGEIVEDFGHGGNTGGAGENISRGHVSIKAQFNSWKNSPGHYNNMIKADYKYFAYAVCTADEVMYGVQLFWTK